MGSLDSSGSQWRRWDLHIHPPSTHLNDAYRLKDPSESREEEFCRRLFDSEIDAFGITDYFDASNIFRIIKMYEDRYPESHKLLLANVELRLMDSVNKDDQFVNYHLIFSRDVPDDRVVDFIRRLPVELKDEETGRRKDCGELKSADYARAMVDRRSLFEAIRNFCGDKVPRGSKLLTLVPAGNDGIRPRTGSPRHAQIARDIESTTDVLLGNDADGRWYLDVDRYAPAKARAMPVFKCSDCHSFAEMDSRHGSDGLGAFTTWVKADLSYEGLRQTVLEPSERVRIADARPDHKEPFKWIRSVSFATGSNFPEEVQLNSELELHHRQ